MINVKVEILEESDLEKFVALIGVFEAVFEMKEFRIPDRAHLQALLSDRANFHVAVALMDNVVVGGLTAYTLRQYYSPRPLVYIYDLAVESELQRQGVGRRLIDYVRSHFSGLGFEEVFVQADRVDAYAVDFYRKTKPTAEEDVLHFYYSL